jgi:UDP-N-acetylglucosamine 2-epimerase (non-hydrolysing)
MIDSLIQLLPAVMQFSKNGVPQRYALVTLHRPSNVDDSANLKNILESLLEVNKRVEVVFPVHPRTRQRIDRLGINIEKLHFLGPLPHIEFLSLQRRAVVVITDSGGVQEETTYLGVPCLTLRSNTERPVTVDMGTNVLVGQDPGLLDSELTKILEGGSKKGSSPPLWDGRASERIVRALQAYLGS